jgi:hypothetical protein
MDEARDQSRQHVMDSKVNLFIFFENNLSVTLTNVLHCTWYRTLIILICTLSTLLYFTSQHLLKHDDCVAAASTPVFRLEMQ